MAAAGPCANLALVLAAALLVRVGMEWNVFHAVPFRSSLFTLVEGDGRLWGFCAALLNVAFALNLIFLVFNLLPLPPLDGSALPLLILPPAAAEKYQAFMWNPSIRLFGLIVAWQIFGNVFPPVARTALQLILPTL
jgi:Zn-dependent protease